MDNRQSTRQSRRAAFQDLPLGQPSQSVMEAYSSLPVAPSCFSFLTDADDDTILRCKYINTYCSLGDQSRHGSIQEHRPRSVYIQHGLIFPGIRAT